MRKELLFAVLVLATLQASCKLVNTHVFKVTGTPEINATQARIATTKGDLLLPMESLSEKAVGILKSLRPFQCLSIRTSEPFEMTARSVSFREFELKKLIEGDRECRKIQTTLRYSVK